MVDGDLSYDLSDIPRFVHKLDQGADLVIGNRLDNIEPGAMPWLHRHVGNPLLSGILNLFFHAGIHDAHCGLRAVRRGAIEELELSTGGMEFASEMIIRASQLHLAVAEVPIVYHPRVGQSKLSTFRDGWRHLHLLLVYAPTYLFIVPGAVMATIGAVVMFLALTDVGVLGASLHIHSLIVGSVATITGTQLIGLGICGHAYGSYVIGNQPVWFKVARTRIRLEQVLLVGLLVLLAGVGVYAYIVTVWTRHGFKNISEAEPAIVGLTLIVLGTQIIFSAFLVSLLGLRRREDTFTR
jgi:hypothetical protein